MADGAFPRDKHLTQIAIAYKNLDTTLIADAVAPRVAVGKRTFEYYEYPEAESYTVPDTRVGEKSRVNQVELKGERRSATVEDFGIEVPLTSADISEAPQGVDPKARATEHATNIVLLDREVRTANLVFDPSRYPAANKALLAGATQWSDPASDPLLDLLYAIDSTLVRSNILVLGAQVWSKLSVHPKLVSAANGNSGENGRCTRERLAELLEISEVIVGSAWVNSAKPGKAPALVNAWGKHALLAYRDRTVTTTGGLTFAITAEYGTRVAGSKEIDIGLHGGVAVRSGESLKELILAPRASFFFQNAVA